MLLASSRRAGNESHRRRNLVALAVAVLIVSACGDAGSDTTTTGGTGTDQTGAATEAPSDTGGGETLVAANNNLGPMEWTPSLACADNEKIMIMISDSLVTLNKETRALEPSLAESYELSEDGTTWTFKLRPDVQFHGDWGTMTAEDVKYTWEQWIAEDSCHNARHQMTQAVDGDMDNFEIVSDLEFRLHTTEPVLSLPAVLCSCDTGMQVVPKAYFEEMGEEANQHPIGTGPWQFVSSTPGVEIVLDAFEDHWNQSPGFDRMVLKEIPDGAARLVQVQSGEVDIALLDGNLLGEAEAADLEISSIPDIGNAFVVLGGMYADHESTDRDAPWVQADEPEKGLAIREAMSLAIDRELILETILGGEGTLAHGIINQYPANPELVDPSWDLPVHDLELAREKLAEGGYPDGFPVTLLLFPQDIDTVAVGEAIAGMWEELGLDVTREPIEEDNLDVLNQSRDTAGRAYVLIQSFKPSIAQGLVNFVSTRLDDSKFFHPAIDDGYLRVEAESDTAVQNEIAREVITELRNDMTALPLFTVNMLFAAGPDIEGWDPVPGVNTFNSMETIQPSSAPR